MMINYILLLGILLLVEVSLQQNGTRYDFVCGYSEETLIAKKLTADVEYEKTEEMYLCLHFAPYGFMVPFKTVVDDFGIIEVKDSYSMFLAKKPATTPLDVKLFVQGQFQNPYSDPQPYFTADSKNEQRIVNVLHLVIHLEYGKIVKFEWIPGCDGCGGTSAAPVCATATMKFWSYANKTELNIKNQFCSVGENDCTGDKIGSCDLKIFVSWKGTDANLHYMVSYANRLENFKKFKIETYYDSMKKYASDRVVSGDDKKFINDGVRSECYEKPGNCLKTKKA